MYPILFRFYCITLYTYGLLVILGALSGMMYVRSQAYRIHMTVKQVYDLFFYILLAGVIGGRLFYIIFNLSQFKHFLDIFKIWQGGLIFYGALFGIIIVCIIFLRLWHIPLWAGFDVITPGAALAHAIGRLGCLMAGCCYGKATNLPWGIQFTHPDSLAPGGVTLHPTQLYSFLSNMIIFIVLHYRLKKKRFEGEVFALYLILYGTGRFIIEMFRGDPRGPVIYSLTWIQYVAAGMFLAGLIGYFRKRIIALFEK